MNQANYSGYYEDLPPEEGKVRIYKSSAGSGKTFALTKEILKLLIRDPSLYDQILAVTFTNDAKEEMKTRVMEELTKIAYPERNNHKDKLEMLVAIKEDFDALKFKNLEPVIHIRAKKALEFILYDYSHFEIGTIDYFFTRLVRHLARELKLNLGYELDVDNEKALKVAMDKLFTDNDPVIMEWLHNFALSRMDEDKGWRIDANLKDLGKELFRESFLEVQEKLNKANDSGQLSEFVVSLRQVRDKFLHNIKSLAKEGLEVVSRHGLVPKDFNRGASTVGVYKKIINGDDYYTKDFSSSFRNAGVENSWATKTSNKLNEIQACAIDGLDEIQSQILQLVDGPLCQEYIEAVAILKNVYSYGVLATIRANLQEYRSENNLLLLSDTSSILTGVITDRETPFIYEKLGSRYKHILIDEFQDTSTYQWKNFLPLLKSALDGAGTVTIVGDVKQSIYRWRGGNMNLLLSQVEEDLRQYKTEVHRLDTNYRSAKNVIEFNNAFFETGAKLVGTMFPETDEHIESIKEAYQEVHQNIRSDIEGSVSIELLSGEDRKDEALKKTKEAIDLAVLDGYPFNEILILTRSNKDAVLAASYLINQGIPVVTEASLQINMSVEVRFLLACMRWLNNQDDRLAKTEMVYHYNQLLGSEVTHRFDSEKLLFSNHPEADLRKGFGRPVYELVEYLIHQFSLNKNHSIYLQQFQEIVLAQARKGNTDLQPFLEWWSEALNKEDKKEISVVLPKGLDAIEIKTVHKSKGLERAVVIMPFLGSAIKKGNDLFWAKKLPKAYETLGALPLNKTGSLLKTRFASEYSKEVLEELLESFNILYVAFTRAKDRLHVFVDGEGKSHTETRLLELILGSEDFNFKSAYPEGSFTLGTSSRNSRESESFNGNNLDAYPVFPLTEKLSLENKASKYFMLFETDVTASIKQGLELHELLSRISNFQDMDSVATMMVQEGKIKRQGIESLQNCVHALFESLPVLLQWFSDEYQVINERPIFMGQHQFIPDRVMIKGNSAIVLDYKSGIKEEKNKSQVRKYASLLREMGYSNVSMYLLYTATTELEEVK